MPIYNYKCTKCGREFEILVLPHEKEPKECPHCGGELVRVYRGSVGLTFKGSGFYITDYAHKNSHATNKPSERKDKKKEDSTGSNTKNS